MAQPPLPLQEFLPLQPLSLDLQPPWPLQAFLPLQACLAGVEGAGGGGADQGAGRRSTMRMPMRGP